MNKTDLAKDMATRMSIPKQDVLLFINTFQASLTALLKEGDSLCLKGFGTFNLWQQQERAGRNPKTGVGCMIQPRTSVKFRPGKDLLDTLNDGKE